MCWTARSSRLGSLFAELLLNKPEHSPVGTEKPVLKLFGEQVAGHPLTFLTVGSDRLAKPVSEAVRQPLREQPPTLRLDPMLYAMNQRTLAWTTCFTL
jgi:hypothetical protein